MTTESPFKSIVAVIGVATLVFGVFKFTGSQAVDAKTPFLEKKLAWCEEALEVTAKIATATRPLPADIARFRQMHWGVMRMMDNGDIHTAMKEYEGVLQNVQPASFDIKGATLSPREQLKSYSLKLANSCKQELSSEWSSTQLF